MKSLDTQAVADFVRVEQQSLVLLTGAGLLIKSLDELHQVDKGFDEMDVLTMNVPLSRSKYPEEPRGNPSSKSSYNA